MLLTALIVVSGMLLATMLFLLIGVVQSIHSHNFHTNLEAKLSAKAAEAEDRSQHLLELLNEAHDQATKYREKFNQLIFAAPPDRETPMPQKVDVNVKGGVNKRRIRIGDG